MAGTLQLPSWLRAQLETWARAAYPHECCGLLVGRQEDGCCQVKAVRRARNLNTERAHDRYELDPRDFLAIDRDARAQQLDIVGVWHTHPNHPARPSDTDLAAAWPELSYLILAVGYGGVDDITSWRLAGVTFEQEAIET